MQYFVLWRLCWCSIVPLSRVFVFRIFSVPSRVCINVDVQNSNGFYRSNRNGGANDNADVGSWCWRRLVAQHTASVLPGFSWSQFELTQLTASSKRSKIVDEIVSTVESGHEPYTWVLSAYRCGNYPWLSICLVKSAVYMTKNWPKHRSMCHEHCRWHAIRPVAHALFPAGQVRSERLMNGVVDAECRL